MGLGLVERLHVSTRQCDPHDFPFHTHSDGIPAPYSLASDGNSATPNADSNTHGNCAK